MAKHVPMEKQGSFQEGVTNVILVREKSNKFDDNAISVHLAKKPGDEKIGYIRAKGQAELLAPWMDKDLLRIESATINSRRGPSTMDLLVKGRACDDAKDMLGAV